MLTLMLRALLVSGLASVAAFLLERALRAIRVGGRHAWTLAALASAALPFVPRLVRDSDLAINLPAISLPAVTVGSGLGTRQTNYLLVFWLLLTGAALLAYAASYVRLQRARRSWRQDRLAGSEVYVSHEYGPAVFGFVRPRIVLPEWVRTTSQEEQRLIVLHEREHIEAADQWLLLLVLAVTAWMPWNPFIWLQARRLRFALEADCDQRVLNEATSDAKRYAQLLVDVGGRQRGLLVTAALAEHRNGLERRIGMIATRIVHNRWKAAALAVVSVVVAVVACESRLPNDERPPQEAKPAGEPAVGAATMSPSVRDTTFDVVQLRKRAPAAGDSEYVMVLRAKALQDKSQMKISTQTPSYMPFTDPPVLKNRQAVAAELVKAYPAELRKAGIGGSGLYSVLVNEDGKVIAAQVKKGTGQLLLDKAGLEVVQTMQFSPALNHGAPVAVWIQLPVVFKVD